MLKLGSFVHSQGTVINMSGSGNRQIVSWNCGLMGHYARICPHPKKSTCTSHGVQDDESFSGNGRRLGGWIGNLSKRRGSQSSVLIKPKCQDETVVSFVAWHAERLETWRKCKSEVLEEVGVLEKKITEARAQLADSELQLKEARSHLDFLQQHGLSSTGDVDFGEFLRSGGRKLEVSPKPDEHLLSVELSQSVDSEFSWGDLGCVAAKPDASSKPDGFQ